VSVLIEDSPRPNLDAWIRDHVRGGTAAGTVISPFATPWEDQRGSGRKPCAQRRVEALHGDGVLVWLDPMTHALQMSGVGDFRYYDQWDLWEPGRRGELSTPADRTDYVRRVFAAQAGLGVRPLAPSVLLHTGLSDTSTRALQLAREAVAQQPGCWITVAGTTPFWSSGHALDAHLGALAGVEPAGWFLVPVKNLTTWPVEADADETHGLCRAARALGDDCPVHISHGDLAALPAIAAGAASVGSGWDRRQRVCSAADYALRPDSPGQATWLARVTLRGLLGALSANEADVLHNQDPALAQVLGGLPAVPAARQRFDHHLEVLTAVTAELTAIADPAQRYRYLAQAYARAAGHWLRVQQLTRARPGADAWNDVLAAGLHRYAATEGFLRPTA